MSKDYTFTGAMTVTVGNPTKKTDYDKVAANTDEINQRMEGVCYVGSLLPNSGGEAITYDAYNRISTIAHTTSPIGTITITYDASNRVSTVAGVFTDPIAATITETYAYNASNQLTGITRVVT